MPRRARRGRPSGRLCCFFMSSRSLTSNMHASSASVGASSMASSAPSSHVGSDRAPFAMTRRTTAYRRWRIAKMQSCVRLARSSGVRSSRWSTNAAESSRSASWCHAQP